MTDLKFDHPIYDEINTGAITYSSNGTHYAHWPKEAGAELTRWFEYQRSNPDWENIIEWKVRGT